ncbi:hypothetical protein C5689_07440 [Methylosinus sporium]|uniref:Uncharacterized protein n=1 Tax=Methylosinus sporium TaxID=428 RepID=A0A2U1SSF6_METSR|nr:hypothetical protein C5689_07440 [Methylosinus sporium]
MRVPRFFRARDLSRAAPNFAFFQETTGAPRSSKKRLQMPKPEPRAGVAALLSRIETKEGAK